LGRGCVLLGNYRESHLAHGCRLLSAGLGGSTHCRSSPTSNSQSSTPPLPVIPPLFPTAPQSQSSLQTRLLSSHCSLSPLNCLHSPSSFPVCKEKTTLSTSYSKGQPTLSRGSKESSKTWLTLGCSIELDNSSTRDKHPETVGESCPSS
jgi:hypothetical protein